MSVARNARAWIAAVLIERERTPVEWAAIRRMADYYVRILRYGDRRRRHATLRRQIREIRARVDTIVRGNHAPS